MADTITPSQKTIQTSRLLLRGTRPGEEIGLFIAFSDAEVMRYWSTLPHKSISDTETWISKMIASPQNGITDFIIVDQSSNNAIGKIGIWSGNEIGFTIAREYWRKGIVSEALNALLPYYFDELGYESITADADPRNEASIAILKKFGFVVTGTREKTFEIGGVWVDSVDLEFKREDWAKSTK
ncbi:GCN5-related N-acetyltransferase [Tothia fuscella]|uniref:GCN5-related N-acetyltransferase n=1 Tax=Tothia fuscella TaxID=1048955 RepID=A0A9P4NMZ7_9PEZI|nr:GCN5-related N-acetyltransferase [Tothia fuscella]